MARAGKVVIEPSHLVGDTRRLAADLKQGGDQVSHNQAFRTGGKIGAATPYRTGALFNTVAVRQVAGGWGVTYGGGLPYAGYIERLRHPVRKGCRGSRTEFRRALEQLAAQAVRRV
jgi:hypothetical protein